MDDDGEESMEQWLFRLNPDPMRTRERKRTRNGGGVGVGVGEVVLFLDGIDPFVVERPIAFSVVVF